MLKHGYKIFDNMMEGIQVIDREFNYVYLNKVAAKHGKHSINDLIGKKMQDIYPDIENTKIFACIKCSFTHSDTFTLPNTFEYPDGSTGYFMLHIEPLEDCVLVMSIDITEQKQTEIKLKKNEELYRLVFEGILEAFLVQELVKDGNGKITDLVYLEANSVAEEILGEKKKNFIGKKCSEIAGELDENTLALIQRVVNSGQPAKMERYVKNNKRWYEVSVYQVHPDQIVTLNLDVTARKEAEEKLQDLNAELEERIKERTKELLVSLARERQLNDLKSRFVSMASHEFRTPLTTILSSVSLIEQYASSEDQPKREKHIARIKGAVKNLTGILNEFLSLDKLEKGLVERHNETFCVSELIQEILRDFETEWPNQRVIFKHDGISEVLLDKTILRNIIINLVSNAIKYSEKDVQLVSTITSGNFNMTITDEGIGIPEKNQDQIFSQFFRAENVGGIEGTGLGLNIVKRYVDILNGTIGFTSKAGQGTSFSISFPVNSTTAH